MTKSTLTLGLGDEEWKGDVDVAAFLVEIVVHDYDCKVTHAVAVSDAILDMDEAARVAIEVGLAREIGRDLAENNDALETVGLETTSGYVVGVESLRAAGFSERLIAALEIRDDQPDNRGVELPDQYVLIEEHDWFESVEPTEPKCISETGHEWAAWGERGQGGAIVETEVCAHCGVYRITNFWMVREPKKIVSYHAADDRSLEWLKSEIA